MLCLNEFGTLDSQHWQRFSDIVGGLRASNTPLHCLGVQAHLGVGKATREMVWARCVFCFLGVLERRV